MTPQEKAKEIFDRMYEAIPAHPEGGSIEYDAAKECALIAVDEILEDRKQIDGMRVINDPYWLEVKNEIEKL
jgi:hypothetical protein